jgi:flagellar biosynthetic protein FliQ
MSDALLLQLVTDTIKTLILVLAPLLLTMLAVGLLVSVFQAVTQVNESTLVFVPKLVASFAVLLIAGPWMANQLTQFTTQVLTMLPQLAR